MKGAAFLLLAWGFLQAPNAHASMQDVKRAYDSGQFFSAARLAFNDANHAPNTAERAMAYQWVTQSLIRAGLDQSALYFFLRTIQLQDRAATKKILDLAPLFIERVGPDLMRKFLTRFTKVEDYSERARNAYSMVAAKERLLKGDYEGAIQNASLVQSFHSLYPVALQLRATAEVMLNRQDAAIEDFEECARKADQRTAKDADSFADSLEDAQPSKLKEKWSALKRDAARDLRSRCIAGQARILYETGKYEEADRAYDRIPKASFVWTDTLFEHAWDAFAKEEYNRALGKLVSYRSPSLQFVFNTEVDVLMTQSYMSLCIYDDAKKVIDNFSTRYGGVAQDVKRFVDANPSDMRPYYMQGRKALADKLHTSSMMNRFMNRFVRSPYFQSLALSEELALSEKTAIERMDASRAETRTGTNAGFPGFLNMALDWRIRTIQRMGGIFVKNSMIDYHQLLIADFEKMQFMKIDILGHQKDKLLAPEDANASERNRGNRIPVRRNDQMLWSFNGEFWNDEIGDYVFALESECAK